LHRGGDQPHAERLGQIQDVPLARALMADHAIGMHLADDRVTELRLCVIDGMAADHRHARLAELARPALHDPVQQARSELVARERRDAKGEQGLRPDNVDVAQRVRRRDRPKLERVVDDRSEEIHGRDERAIGRDSVDGRVVARRRGVEHVGIDDRRQRAENLPELDGAELAGAARAVAVLREPHLRNPVHSLVSIPACRWSLPRSRRMAGLPSPRRARRTSVTWRSRRGPAWRSWAGDLRPPGLTLPSWQPPTTFTSPTRWVLSWPAASRAS